MLNAGESGKRTILGGHRNIVCRLCEHRRLASNRVAQHGKSLGGSHRKSEKPIQILQARFEGFLQSEPLLQPPREIPCGNFRIVVRAKIYALPLQSFAQAAMIAKRSVVNEAEIPACGKWVRTGCGDGTLRSHPCVADCMRTAHSMDAKPRDDIMRRARFFHDLYASPKAHDRDVCHHFGKHYTNFCLARRDVEERMCGVDRVLDRLARAGLQLIGEPLPVECNVWVIERDLEGSFRRRGIVNRKTRAVWAPAA